MSANSEHIALNNPLELYAQYSFASDETYQKGLLSILADATSSDHPQPEVLEEIMRRTRVFYFNRVTGNSITTDEAREYEHSHLRGDAASDSNISPSPASASPHTPGNADGNRILTFAELQHLIETGKVDQIPNNKIIPEVLNEAFPSVSGAPLRKKPWEVTGSGTETELGDLKGVATPT